MIQIPLIGFLTDLLNRPWEIDDAEVDIDEDDVDDEVDVDEDSVEDNDAVVDDAASLLLASDEFSD
jgi:hypothetical protein